jgi:putative transposase
LLGNTQASKVPRTVTLEVDPRRLAVWTLGDLYTILCEWAYEVDDQMAHPALDQSPRAMFVNGLAKGGERTNRGIAYDDVFIKATLPTRRSEKGMIQRGKGIKLFLKLPRGIAKIWIMIRSNVKWQKCAWKKD